MKRTKQPYQPQAGDVCEWKDEIENKTIEVLILGDARNFDLPFNFNEEDQDVYCAICSEELFDTFIPYCVETKELSLIHRPK